jgi:ABC-type bacteriocin/lantibiotic exporter with double-glycine peptidase domain
VILRLAMIVWAVAAAIPGPPATSGSAAGTTGRDDRVELEVPIVEQRPERCGPAALEMVLRFHGATAAQVELADSAYDPVLRGALITDLAAWARRAGFEARVARLAEDSLVALLHEGLPPVLLYARGIGPVTRQHYAVLVGWDGPRQQWTLHDGRNAPRHMTRRDLASRWSAAGCEALVVRPRSP